MERLAHSESEKDPLRIPYNIWHPPASDQFWQRLEVPNHGGNGRYSNERRFNRRDFWNTDAKELISHKDKLVHYDQQFGTAFAVEDYLQRSGVGQPYPRILEIGSWPMKNHKVATRFENTLVALLAQDPSKRVVGVDFIDLRNDFSPPHFGDATFINADFHEEETQQKIIEALGGKPHVIVGNMTFEKRLGNWLARDSGFGGFPDMSHVAEKLAEEAFNFLGTDGVLIACNRGYGKFPDVFERTKLVAVYEDQKGDDYVQVRKIKNKIT